MSVNKLGVKCFANLPGGWFPKSTISSLNFSFSIFPYTTECSSIRQIINKVSQELKRLHIIKLLKEYCLLNSYELAPIKSSSRPFIMSSSGFHTLYKLSLFSIIFTKNSLKNLASLSNLEFLKIEYSSLGEEGKKIIGNFSLPKLQNLELNENSLAINKFLIRIEFETLETLDIIFTNSQIENGELNEDFLLQLIAVFPTLLC
ncbi:23087_t:CDS:2 [Gigaspora margarita]|uniref:23087_t:CDS:1 n=1 Tax=Gigaspora margarita TaxID=4874 RepID=A0ABM8VVI3_GIGMA|nr:23087_t:CDS:2 [Gigaspora margarita]